MVLFAHIGDLKFLKIIFDIKHFFLKCFFINLNFLRVSKKLLVIIEINVSFKFNGAEFSSLTDMILNHFIID